MRTYHDVLTDVPGEPGQFWGDRTTRVGPTDPPRWLVRLLGPTLASDVTGAIAGAKMFLMRDAAAGIVTGGGACGITVALLQRLLPWGRRPHVMIDGNWHVASSPLKRWVMKNLLRLTAPAVTRYVVCASHVVRTEQAMRSVYRIVKGGEPDVPRQDQPQDAPLAA